MIFDFSITLSVVTPEAAKRPNFQYRINHQADKRIPMPHERRPSRFASNAQFRAKKTELN